RLGTPHLPEAGNYFVTYDDYVAQHPGTMVEDDPTDPNGPVVWPNKVSDLTRQWLKSNEKPLALLAEATKRPRYFIPFYGGFRTQTLIEVLIPHVGLLRQTRRPLLTRAMLRLNDGDYAGFHDDVMTVHWLARLMAQSSTLVERMVAKDMDIAACRIEGAAAAGGKLSVEQCKSLAAESIALGDLQPITDAWNMGERLMGLDVLQMLARSNPVHAGTYLNAAIGGSSQNAVARIEPPFAFLFIPISYEQNMIALNHFHDSAMAAIELRSYPQRAAMMRLWAKQLNESTRHGPVMILTTPDWADALLLPQLDRTIANAEIARVQRRLTQVALALAAFKAEHAGTYPAALDELSPQYLPAVPSDLFLDKPLIYSRTNMGYALRSVGPNMTDDGGAATGKGRDDIVADVP
ncbi:MAG TPA: hypothetical protein VLI90_11700, partial [Tepidisphaeraceae bacterium]|nr:hypothetical protein [Tepidisphaeraceae bacterium]